MIVPYHYSVTGTQHLVTGQENQDRISIVETGRCLVAALADGVSSSVCCAEGAACSCAAAAKLLTEETVYFFESGGAKAARLLLDYIRRQLERAAFAAGREVSDYASTLSLVCIDKRTGCMLLFQLGDSTVFLLRDGALQPAFPAYVPGEGRGVYTTCTRDAALYAAAGFLPAEEAERVLICSDGAWRRLYALDRIGSEASAAALAGPVALAAYLEQGPCPDDCSFVYLDLHSNGGDAHG